MLAENGQEGRETMILTLRRIITQIFGSAQVEQVDRVVRTGAEMAARRGTSGDGSPSANPTERLNPADHRPSHNGDRGGRS
jgi:hypothetical protein